MDAAGWVSVADVIRYLRMSHSDLDRASGFAMRARKLNLPARRYTFEQNFVKNHVMLANRHALRAWREVRRSIVA